MNADGDSNHFHVGDKLVLTVREQGHGGPSGDFVPFKYLAQVEQILKEDKGAVQHMKVRWHMPRSLGYNTEKGVVSPLVHIANGVWLEARKKRAKNKNVAVAKAEVITEEQFQKLLAEAAAS